MGYPPPGPAFECWSLDPASKPQYLKQPPNSETEAMEGSEASLGAQEASVLFRFTFCFPNLESLEASPIFLGS